MSIGRPAIEMIVGLGNPGPEYAETRHNAGFWFVDRLLDQHAGHWASDSRRDALVSRVGIGDHLVRLLKPMAFMNRSGQAVAGMAHYFKIPPEKVLIVHDELDLAAGDVRIKFAGGHGGHNGLRDVINHFASAGFWRCRVGIDHPGIASQVANYVLKPPFQEQLTLIEGALERLHTALPNLLKGDPARARAIQAMHSTHPKKSSSG